jgi:hypothetical protein
VKTLAATFHSPRASVSVGQPYRTCSDYVYVYYTYLSQDADNQDEGKCARLLGCGRHDDRHGVCAGDKNEW